MSADLLLIGCSIGLQSRQILARTFTQWWRRACLPECQQYVTWRYRN